jgi:hypothetical protein
MWPKILILGASSVALVSCSSAGGGCPPLVVYSAAQQRLAARELRLLPKNAQIAGMVGDYGKMRKACRLWEAP